MIDDGLRWPDIEGLVIAHLTGTADWVSTDAPAAIEGRTGLRVTGVPSGSDDGVSDFALVDVEAFAPTREAAADLASETRVRILALAGRAIAGRLVDTVTTIMRPAWLDYRNPAVQRFAASYQLVTRPSIPTTE